MRRLSQHVQTEPDTWSTSVLLEFYRGCRKNVRSFHHIYDPRCSLIVSDSWSRASCLRCGFNESHNGKFLHASRDAIRIQKLCCFYETNNVEWGDEPRIFGQSTSSQACFFKARNLFCNLFLKQQRTLKKMLVVGFTKINEERTCAKDKLPSGTLDKNECF